MNLIAHRDGMGNELEYKVDRAALRDAVLEEAALVCDDYATRSFPREEIAAAAMAEAIRALKSPSTATA